MPSSLSRRSFTGLVSSAAAALTLPFAEASAQPQAQISAQLQGEPHHGADGNFPHGFLWGSATAAYQVEGAIHEGGRGVSIWDTFSQTPGKIADNGTGAVADDFFHSSKRDIGLMRSLGLTSFRFSVSWTRVFPDGGAMPNPHGLDFYNRLVDDLLAAGIQPFCTLYHWDLPQTLQDKGGWENRDTAQAFAGYAGYTAHHLSDRVKAFMTINEMRTFVEHGYGDGTHAPGLQVGPKRLAQLTHHVVLGHGLAVQAIRASTKPGTEVGLAEIPIATVPVIETPEHVEAARKAMREENAMFLTVVLEGRYTDAYLKRLGADAPKFTAEELAIIGSPVDFVGTNVYFPAYVRADASDAGYALVPMPVSFPHMESAWLNIGPEALYWVPKLTAELWHPKAIYITENGTSGADALAADGQVYDTDRIMFLRSYLLQLQRAVAEGVPVRGYFLWSLLDNFEWADGYGKRFGIVHVDYKTQVRTPKLSAEYYAAVVRSNRAI